MLLLPGCALISSHVVVSFIPAVGVVLRLCHYCQAPLRDWRGVERVGVAYSRSHRASFVIPSAPWSRFSRIGKPMITTHVPTAVWVLGLLSHHRLSGYGHAQPNFGRTIDGERKCGLSEIYQSWSRDNPMISCESVSPQLPRVRCVYVPPPAAAAEHCSTKSRTTTFLAHISSIGLPGWTLHQLASCVPARPPGLQRSPPG